MLTHKTQRLSNIKEVCYSEGIETLQHISTSFSPAEKLQLIQRTFDDLNKVRTFKLSELTKPPAPKLKAVPCRMEKMSIGHKWENGLWRVFLPVALNPAAWWMVLLSVCNPDDLEPRLNWSILLLQVFIIILGRSKSSRQWVRMVHGWLISCLPVCGCTRPNSASWCRNSFHWRSDGRTFATRRTWNYVHNPQGILSSYKNY